MRSLRWTLPLVTLLSLFGAGEAHATVSAVTINTAGVVRTESDGKTTYSCPDRNTLANSCIVEGKFQGIGYHDCVDDTVLVFPLQITGLPDAQNHLEVWAGTTDCTQAGATHNASTATCWPIASPPNATNPMTVNIRVADIVANLNVTPPPQNFTSTDALTACGNAAKNSTTSTVTDDAGNTTTTAGESTVSIFFMFFPNGGNTPVVNSPAYSVKVKLAGPNACTNVQASPGDGEIIVTWSPPAGDTTVQGFDLFAAPSGSTTSLGDSGTQTVCSDASSGTELLDDAGNPILDDAGNPIFVDDAGNPVSQDAGCTTTNTGPTVNSCSGTTGTFDVSGISCGTSGDAGANGGICQMVSGATNAKATIQGINNNTEYDVAVAAFDAFGNTGSISQAACATPQPINDFWKLYNQDGGNAYCALSVVGKHGGGVAAGLVSIFGMIWLRRRRSKRS